MNECCRAAVIAELRAQATWIRDHALSLPLGDAFSPGMCAAAGALEENANILELRTEAAPGDTTDSCSTCGVDAGEACLDGCAYARAEKVRTGWRLPSPTL